MPQVGQTRGNTTNWSASTTYLVETRHDCRSWNATIAVDNKEKRVALHVIDTPVHGRLSSYQASSHRVQCCNLHFLPSIYSERRFVSTPTSILCTLPPIGERSIVMSVCLSVCLFLSAIISSELHVRSSPNVLCMLPMAVARSSSGGVVILPVLLMTSCLLISQCCSTSPPS